MTLEGRGLLATARGNGNLYPDRHVGQLSSR